MRLFEDDAEESVELMIKQGRKIVDDVLDTYRPVAIFGGFSGGDDSIVACHFAATEFGSAVVHCDTTIAMETNYKHVLRTADKLNWQLIVKQAQCSGPPKTTRKYINGKRIDLPFDPKSLPTGKWQDGTTPYEEYCYNFGMPGPGQHGRMYQRLKERTFNAIRKEAKQGHDRKAKIVIITGIRSDESKIRAGYKRAVSKVGGTVWVNPFYWQTAREFELYRQEFGLPRNPVKPIVGISGDCLCGTMGSSEELKAIEKLEPQKKIYISSMESKCESLGLPCRYATSPPPTKTNIKSRNIEASLFGAEPEFQPACIGCIRRSTAS